MPSASPIPSPRKHGPDWIRSISAQRVPIKEKKKALIVVRTYPTPAKTGAEVSCTAAITDDGKWLRLFPVPWRYLSAEQQFRRYQWVEARVLKASDPRPESYKLAQDGIKIISEVPPDNE